MPAHNARQGSSSAPTIGQALACHGVVVAEVVSRGAGLGAGLGGTADDARAATDATLWQAGAGSRW